MGSKSKNLFKESHIWACWCQNVGPSWVKNSKKGYFHNSHLTTTQPSQNQFRLSIDNTVWLDSADTKTDSQDAVNSQKNENTQTSEVNSYFF